MALVAYDNSDSSDYEDDSESPAVSLNQKLKDLPPQNDLESKQKGGDQNLFNLLPKPSKETATIKEEEDEILHKKEVVTDIKPKSRITVPSLDDFKDVKDTKPNVKPRISNGKKSGLLSILPQPKNSSLSVSSKMLIPQSVSKKPLPTAKKKEPLPSPIKKVETKTTLIAEYSDDSDEDVQGDFFSINKPVELPPDDSLLDIDLEPKPSEPEKKQPRTLESYFKKEEHVTLEPDYESMETVPEQSTDYSNQEYVPLSEEKSNDVLDEEAILKLCGARGKRKREEIQIVDVNQQEVLRDAREMLLKGLMDDTTKRQSHSKKKGNEPTSQQKRKHQITYLAHQAKANEAELQNQWANNRMTKRQTQSKYGF